MADLVPFNPSPVFVGVNGMTKARAVFAGVGGLTLGQAVYQDPTSGTFLPTTTATAGNYGFRGLMMAPARGGAYRQAVDIVSSGYVAGWDLSALAYDAPIYLSDTPGMLSSTPGTNSVQIGRVEALTDVDPSNNYLPSKVIHLIPTAN